MWFIIDFWQEKVFENRIANPFLSNIQQYFCFLLLKKLLPSNNHLL